MRLVWCQQWAVLCVKSSNVCWTPWHVWRKNIRSRHRLRPRQPRMILSVYTSPKKGTDLKKKRPASSMKLEDSAVKCIGLETCPFARSSLAQPVRCEQPHATIQLMSRAPCLELLPSNFQIDGHWSCLPECLFIAKLNQCWSANMLVNAKVGSVHEICHDPSLAKARDTNNNRAVLTIALPKPSLMRLSNEPPAGGEIDIHTV